jgi:SAM-dependent methyltransferase
MRSDWNERAREDAHYYVAFGRREQDDEEFFATAADVIRELEAELKRFPSDTPLKSRRALEIGCGPGRLLRPMSRRFGEIHGIDVSDEMIAKARVKLRDVAHAHVHAASGSDLALFPDEHFDFVYSYAVFQHIPSAEVVFSYLRETVRVLRPGGFAHLQINGLPKTAKAFTTWEGVRISAAEVMAFTREHGIRLLSLNGVETQYMWTTWQKPPLREMGDGRFGDCRIQSVANAFSSERAIPASGRLACAALTVENLPDEARDMNVLTAHIGGLPGVICYIGPRGLNHLTHLNVFLPKGVGTGLLPVRLDYRGERLCPDTWLRVIPAGPPVPYLTAISDGVNLLSAQRIESGTMKVTIEEVQSIEGFRAVIDDVPVEGIETFRTDPLAERYEVNFRVPAGIGSGGHVLDVWLGNRRITQMGIEVVR